MSVFNITYSVKKAERHFGSEGRPKGRRPRSDRGRPRINPLVVEIVREVTSGYDRPAFAEFLTAITDRCVRAGLRPPSRATLYKLLLTLPTPLYRVADLPPAVQRALYNLGGESEVPGHQLAFYCFNYGDSVAMSFASGLPWLSLYQAIRMRGHRDRSRDDPVAGVADRLEVARRNVAGDAGNGKVSWGHVLAAAASRRIRSSCGAATFSE